MFLVMSFLGKSVMFGNAMKTYEWVTRVMDLVMSGNAVVIMFPPLVKGGTLLLAYRQLQTDRGKA